jgi:type 2 lantibiotic biosynthesis protein LanM
MHFENLLAAGEFPMPVDLETLFHHAVVAQEESDPASEAYQSSVMPVMLLPHPVYRSVNDEGVDMSGFGARSGTRLPFGSTLAWDKAGTDEMRVARNTSTPAIVAKSCPILDGSEVAASDYAECFVAGFRRVYRLIEAGRDGLRSMLDRFAQVEVRFVPRGTATYAEILRACQHPDRLRDAIDVDRVFDHLWPGAAQQSRLTRLIPAELKDLRTGDVPVFTSRPSSRDLWTSDGEPIPGFFDRPVLSIVCERLNLLGDEDLARQEAFIRTAIATAGESPSSSTRGTRHKLRLLDDKQGAIDLACAAGDALCSAALEDESCASWLGTTPMGPGRSTPLQPLEPDLYSGLSGCALFLAYLGAVTHNRSYERIARKTSTLVRRHTDPKRPVGLAAPGLGAFSGLGGIIYALTHLGVLWQDSSLISDANARVSELPALIATDKTLDVIGGSAGVIAILDVLNKISPDQQLLDVAVACGERILDQQRQQPTGVGWMTSVDSSQPLTGFSHGAAGIAWALLKLSVWSGQSRFRTIAESAIAYERSTFVREEANWPDYRLWPGRELAPRCERAWCHGAPGIALARIDSLPFMNDADTREEIAIGLRTTAQSPFGMNHCLCHGDLGNLDILRHAAERGDDSCWNDAGARLAVQTIADIAERGYVCTRETSLTPLGLMTGLAGVGYGLLRLACPERVPSVLALAPPVGS